MTIRHAEPADLPALAVLFDLYRQFYQCKPDYALAKAYLEARMSRQESHILLAESRGQLDGFTQLYPTFCSIDAGRILVLYDLFVASEQRRKGIAKQLMDAAHAVARDEGALRLDLETAIDNFPAQALYEKLGYQRDNEFFKYSYTL